MNNKLNSVSSEHVFSGYQCLAGYTVPFRIWVMADFSLAEKSDSQLLRVSRNNLNDVIKNFNIELSIFLDNLIPQSDTRSYIKLPVHSMQDFDPFNVADNVDALAALLQCHQAIKNRLAGKISDQRLHEIIEPYQTDFLVAGVVKRILQGVDEAIIHQPVQTAKVDDEAIDRLFGMLDLGGDQQPKSEAEPNTKGNTKGNTKHSTESTESGGADLTPANQVLLNSCLNDLKRPLFKHLNTILHGEDFQQLEQSWRGLQFLLDAQNDDENIEIAIIDSNKQNLIKIYQLLLSKTVDEELPSVLICDFSTDCTPADMNMMDELAAISEAYQIPAMINLSNQFLGVHHASELLGGSGLAPLFSQAQYVKWNSLRNKPKARWLLCAFNRFMLRPEYNRHNNSTLEFNEWLNSDEYLLMGHAGWFVAHVMLLSLRQHQWPTELAAPLAPKVDDLPVYQFDISPQKSIQIALETVVDDKLQQDLFVNGITSLQAKPGSASVFLTKLPMLFKPALYDNVAVNLNQQIMNSFPHLLLTSRLALLISSDEGAIHQADNVESLKQKLINYLQSLIADTRGDESVAVTIVEDSNKPGQYLAKINVTLGKNILNNRAIELQLPL
ncbi:MAG: type VI secretion system contractile sheath large subunit [Gammaproteobacteria bacterium]|nr:type VI secretion system contractile sheath large subunit [Gammaproteobacteria bacterium]